MHVHTHADQPPRHGAFELVAARQVSGVRATRTHGHAKALCGADHNVRTPFARRCQKRQRQRVSGGDESRLPGMHQGHVGAQVINTAAGGRVLCQHRKIVALQGGFPLRGRIGEQHGEPKRFGAGLNDFNGLRMAIARHDESVALAFNAAFGQRHGLGGSGGLIEH